MEEYTYDQLRIMRYNNCISIFDDNYLIKRLELLPENITLGKINIPLSNVCTMKCKYCSEADYIREEIRVMAEEDAYLIIDSYLEYIRGNSEIQSVRLSFDYGGEPVCQLKALENISEYFRKTCNKYGRQPTVEITTNCAWHESLLQRILSATDEVIVSIDGYKELHEKYRIHRSEGSVFSTIMNNAKSIYCSGKLKQISSVVTEDTLADVEHYINFLRENFPNGSVRMSPVIVTGDAENNGIERIPFSYWIKFTNTARNLANGKLKILDTKPEKSLTTMHHYGCEHMQMTNWFCWLDGKITCCTDRDTDIYVIGILDNHVLKMDYEKMSSFIEKNYVENIVKCDKCLAKYYCAGGCPSFRDGTLNCNRRIEKYAKLLVEKA